ncbi:MAG: acetyltransferase [Weeksellaceae bacterium]|jgi:acetyltransferase EpsM|nr:acetyltransferase [Weeksellaceae bacterium]
MYLFGASGHGKVVAEIAKINQIEITAVIDEDVNKRTLLGHEVIHEVPETPQAEVIISVGNNQSRKNIVERFPGFRYPVLRHPASQLSVSAVTGEGTVVMAGALVNSEAKIGKHCIINSNAVVEHECEIGDFVHVSPSASLAGNVIVGEGSQIGIGASVIQGIKIGKWCTIGAGAVVIRDVPDGATVVGNPAKIIQ